MGFVKSGLIVAIVATATFAARQGEGLLGTGLFAGDKSQAPATVEDTRPGHGSTQDPPTGAPEQRKPSMFFILVAMTRELIPRCAAEPNDVADADIAVDGI